MPAKLHAEAAERFVELSNLPLASRVCILLEAHGMLGVSQPRILMTLLIISQYAWHPIWALSMGLTESVPVQWRHQLDIFSNALQTGQLDVRAFGLEFLVSPVAVSQMPSHVAQC